MARVDEMKNKLERGRVYRRADLSRLSNSVDRHLGEMVGDGTLLKISPGVYYAPNRSVFGKTPPNERDIVKAFLKDDRFLLTSPNLYNSLGVGTTQLYNKRIVYNHKRHGLFRLGNREFDFRIKPHFPKKLSEEFLLVDLLNNLDTVAEDRNSLLENVKKKVKVMDWKKIQHAVALYGNVRTKKLFHSLVE
jgi:hypothetical protein